MYRLRHPHRPCWRMGSPGGSAPNPAQEREQKARDVLVGAGLDEAITYSLTNMAEVAKLSAADADPAAFLGWRTRSPPSASTCGAQSCRGCWGRWRTTCASASGCCCSRWAGCSCAAGGRAAAGRAAAPGDRDGRRARGAVLADAEAGADGLLRPEGRGGDAAGAAEHRGAGRVRAAERRPRASTPAAPAALVVGGERVGVLGELHPEDARAAGDPGGARARGGAGPAGAARHGPADALARSRASRPRCRT